MADFHKYKFLYAGNQAYADGYDRIFKKVNHENNETHDQDDEKSHDEVDGQVSQTGKARRRSSKKRKSQNGQNRS